MSASGIEQAIKRLHPEDGDIVLISSTTPISRQTYDAIGRYLRSRGEGPGKPNILFLWMEEGADISTVSEKKMAEHGWQRIPKEETRKVE